MTQTIEIKEPQAPASEKQVAFLAVLLKERECPTIEEKARLAKTVGMTKGVASKLITEALKAPKKTGQVNSVQDWAQAKAVEAAPVLKPTLTELPGYGYWMIDGTLYYWDVTGKDTFPTLRKLVILTTYSGAKKGSWKKVYAPYGKGEKVTATWVPYAGKGYNKSEVTKTITIAPVLADAALAGAKPLTQDEAGALGKQFGFCVRCGATLTDPVSVANGLGPVCAKYWA